MKQLYKIKRKAGAGILILMAGIFLFSCVNLIEILYNPTVKAGEVATFTMKLRMEPHENHPNIRLVIAILVPKSWDAAKNAKLTYINSLDNGISKNMSLIPANVPPKNQPGLSWSEALRQKYGFGANVLDDMEWVAYWSDEVGETVNNLFFDVDVRVDIKVSKENIRAKLGFFVNHSEDGLGNSVDHYKIGYTDCFEVVDGEGPLFDFCEAHINLFTPSYVTKDDIVTVKFQGDVEPTVLDGVRDIYLNAKVYTHSGQVYTVDERSAKTKMQLEQGKTFSLTFWPGDYFNIPADEEIEHIEYYFTNADGTLSVKETNDDGSTSGFEMPFMCRE
ncbi:MAG: DUF4961 domain-containing protein [Dysgonamonadaceae bacterium]|jgi:hypothetical protein|nr:DUF4961 domain-containing protein [Dysgonamonadaceae bacterium]